MNAFYFFLSVFIYTEGVQIPSINNFINAKSNMETIQGYKIANEKKRDILYSRMDETMINRLRDIRRKSGISVSEIIREAVRRLLQEVDETGSINLKLN